MEALTASLFPALHKSTTSLNKLQQLTKPLLTTSPFSITHKNLPSKSKLYTTLSSSAAATTVSADVDVDELETGEKFDWFAQWYPVMPVCDLDKRVPHAKRVLGLDVVVWWDKNESGWRVFDDSCPHRLAPLSEGRIDQWGRLQCVYHGWCFNGSGDCKFIPQAPPDGPPVHTFKKACVNAYPSTVQNGIVWFWPNSEPQYKDILLKKKPPNMPEMDDPSYTKSIGNRDMPYGYEVLIENLMDPAHVPYAHYKIMRIPQAKDRVKADKEGGVPIEMSAQGLGISGFTSKRAWGGSKFIAPCVYYAFPEVVTDEGSVPDGRNGSASPAENKKEPPVQRRVVLIFICVPVSPGKSRVIWCFPRNFAVWIDRIFPRWIFHLNQNLVLDSDLYFLHLEERKIMAVGPSNWQKACFVPTKSDANVVAFRKWLNKYSGGQINWGDKFKFDLALPPIPKEQLMDRYWSHVVNCRSCSVAHKGLGLLEVALQVVSIISIGVVAATKHKMPATARITLVSTAILCFAASKWLSHFIYKNFHFHDYNHALVE
ncbi:protochlorophyllide-dependent translocon component 52, chloroplastic-like [Pistacia vera]|uniref:protochlorophyllide-dependent translocon component 52, chloroplastic-like n=1 Tax=Pistacia vera TaxID=55513 RepID=UPI00126383B5|nr:protochlorophyllide-dependent translocon component 52, chloroplastic-like [Pistacia vera]